MRFRSICSGGGLEIVRGRLRINASVTFGRHGLTPPVTRFLHDFPEVEMEMTLSNRAAAPNSVSPRWIHS